MNIIRQFCSEEHRHVLKDEYRETKSKVLVKKRERYYLDIIERCNNVYNGA